MMERLKKDLRGRCWRKVTIYFLVCCLVLNTSLPAVFALDPGDMGGVGSSASAVLNRITSASATQFNGALNANGRVFVVNPAGIIFGTGSTVNVSQLVASGLGMTDEAFNNALAGADMHFTGGSGIVRTRAEISADTVILVGKKVINVSSIQAPDGLIVLAAGEEVLVAQDGSNVLVNVSEGFYGEDTTPDVENRSSLQADRGQIVLAAGDTFSRAIRNGAFATSLRGSITARAAHVENEGTMNVRGDDGLRSITLSGVEEVVSRGASSMLIADGLTDGDGGTITLESSEGSVSIGADSTVSAVGGSASGDGGYIKITGEHFSIAPTSTIDASNQNADDAPGTFEIDPPIVTVANGANLGAADTIYEDDIETLSTTGTNVIVRANAVNVQDMTGDGAITGGVGGIELHGTDCL